MTRPWEMRGSAIRVAGARRVPIWNLAVAEHAAIWRELTA